MLFRLTFFKIIVNKLTIELIWKYILQENAKDDILFCGWCCSSAPVADGILDSLRFIFWSEVWTTPTFGHQVHVLERCPELTATILLIGRGHVGVWACGRVSCLTCLSHVPYQKHCVLLGARLQFPFQFKGINCQILLKTKQW